MRLIDADALKPRLDWHCNALDIIDAAPTVPTTERKGGVTSCAFCGCVVDIEYPDDAETYEEVGG